MKTVNYDDINNLTGESILDLEQIIDLFKLLDWKKGAFLSMEINDTCSLQIMYHAPKTFLIEITNNSDEMIFLQKYGSHQEVIELIYHFYESEETKTLSGFYEVPILSKSLDKIIKESNSI